MADGGAGVADIRSGFFDWDFFIGRYVNPTTQLGMRLEQLKNKWNAARTAAEGVIDKAVERHHIFREYIDRANSIQEMRIARATQFSGERNELKRYIRGARQEVLNEIMKERMLIQNRFHAATAGLRFYKPLDWFSWARAGIAHMGRRFAHRANLVLHPVYIRTHRRKTAYRQVLRQKGQDHASTDTILRKTQKAHVREAWRAAVLGHHAGPAPAAPGGGGPGGPGGGPGAGPAPV